MRKLIIFLLLLSAFSAGAQKFNYGSRGAAGTIINEKGPVDFQLPFSIPTLDSFTIRMKDSMSDATHPNIFPFVYRLKADSTVWYWDVKLRRSTHFVDSAYARLVAANVAKLYMDTAVTKANAHADSSINSFLANAVFGGSVDSTSNPHPTVNTFYFATQAALTYDSMGGFRVYSNSFAIISYKAIGAVWSISQTPLDLSGYETKSHLYNPKNLFNKDSIVDGFYLSSSTGLPVVSANSSYSKYIEVEPSTIYTFSNAPSLSDPTAAVFVYYTSSFVKITQHAGLTEYTDTTPSNAKYVRFNVRFNSTYINYDRLQYEKGSVATYYRPFNPTKIDSALIDINGLGSVQKSQLFVYKNLFNKNGLIVTGEHLSTSTGNPSAAATSAHSDYIAVTANTTYTLSGVISLSDPSANCVVFYDSTKTKISFLAGAANFTHTTPTNTRYVRFNLKFGATTADYSLVQYEASAAKTSYLPYGVPIINDSLVSYNGVVKNSDIYYYKNLFDSTLITTGRYLNATTGATVVSATSAYSGYVPVLPNTTYTVSGLTSLSDPSANVIAFYDSTFTLISGTPTASGLSNYTHTTPLLTKYVRFNVRFVNATADYSKVQYEQAPKATQYKTFGQPIVKYSLIDDTTTSGTYIDYSVPKSQIYLFPCYGQSLSINTDAGASTFPDSTAVYNAYDVFMKRNIIQDMNGGYVEMFNTLSSEFSASDSVKVMTCLGGAGGKSVLQLSKPSTYYTTLINNVIRGKRTADSMGLTFNVPAFLWTQGEEDMRCAGVPANYGSGIWNPFDYSKKLSNLIDSLNKDIKAITGQKNDVKCVMYQVGSHNAYYRYPRIAMEQLKLAINDKRVSLAKTMYDVEYNTADYVHAPAKTYRNMGDSYGIHLYDIVKSTAHPLPIFPVSSYIVGTDIYIRFHVPNPPLVFDTTIVSPLPDGKYGFNLYTVTNETAGSTGTIALATQTITSVSLYNSNTVKISMSALPPAGTRLTYAVNGDGSLDIDGAGTGGKSGPTLGARGNLMDSRTYMNVISGTLVKLPNRCPIFEIVF